MWKALGRRIAQLAVEQQQAIPPTINTYIGFRAAILTVWARPSCEAKLLRGLGLLTLAGAGGAATDL